MKSYCPLCCGLGDLYYNQPGRKFYLCEGCGGLFVPTTFFPDWQEEKERYLEHNNDVNDPRYRAFVAPIVNAVMNAFGKESSGLDFGAGTGPVVSTILRENDYQIELYDPFFHPHPYLLKKTYDFIVSCEVVEHFFKPRKEFQLMKSLLKPNGKLFCMTGLYNNTIDFSSWQYKNDFTHVFIYQKKTMEWIRENFGFSGMENDGNLVVFTS
ncbi:MAG: class I SAM-dependent methyltransferase [Bacteroidetes bacterium]|nr:MAG: class I SAM-dependent methyltransferase [Bacteroidota bacterium]